MTNNTLSKKESQKIKLEEKYKKILAQINRIEATKSELLRKNDKDIRMQQNAKLIEIGRIICESINVSPLDINIDEFQDFVNHTQIAYRSSGNPLTPKPGLFCEPYPNVWKNFHTPQTKKCFEK